MGKKKQRKKQLKYYTDIIANICAALAIFTNNFKSDWVLLLENIANTIIKYKYILILVFIYIIVMRYIVCVIPQYRINIKGIPNGEASPSIFSIVIATLVFVTSILFLYINFDDLTKAGDNQNKGNQNDINIYISNIPTDNDKIYNNESENIVEDIENSFEIITEDELVEKYILMAYNEEIPEDILKTLSRYELYLIRNGIYAYEGLYFKSGYYERFSWYNGYILSEEEVWGKINPCQYINIKNIEKIEKTYK